MHRFGLHLNALRAFEAAARLSSFSLAAEELHVSHSTISHHVKGLEKALGLELFLRQNRGVVLTSAGEILLPVLKSAFDKISATLETLKESHEQPALRVTVTPSFANTWLMPRLRGFREAHHDIEVQLNSSLSLIDSSHERFDVGVRSGNGEWPGLTSELLLPIHMTPLCHPSLLEGREGLKTPRELSGFTLIHAGVESEWQEWLAAVGVDDIDCSHGLSFHDPGLALQAAINGLGMAMGYVELAASDLGAGNLVQPFTSVVQHPWSYYIVIPENKVCDPRVNVFCDWLRSEVHSAFSVSATE